MGTPLVIVFDLDGTLIGLVNLLVSGWLSVKDSNNNMTTPEFQQALTQILKEDQVARPYIKDFMERLKAEFGNVEFFVYTASKKQWAEHIVFCLEKAFDIKFRRPIFNNEEHTYWGYKLIKKILPDIQTDLITKYGVLSQNSIRERLVVFDDCPHVYDDVSDMKKIIRCPSYKTFGVVDIVEHVPKETLKVSGYKSIAKNLTTTMNVKFEQKELETYKEFDKKWRLLYRVIKENVEKHEEEPESRNYWKDFDLSHIHIILNNT